MWVQDRFDDGRRVAERTLHDGRKVAERTWHDGRKVAERGFDEGRRVAGRTFLDGRREAERALDEGRHLVADRLGDGRKAIRDRFGGRAPAVEAGVLAGAVLWPALTLAAGASVAYFCWSQYMRGRAERSAQERDEPGGEGPHIPEPELVMAHNAAPKPQGREAVDPSDTDLAEPAEELMLHSPPDGATPEGVAPPAMKPAPRAAGLGRAGKKAGMPEADDLSAKAKALASTASVALAGAPAALESSLAVQGASSASKRRSPNGATPPSAKPRRKGPTVM